MKPLRHAAVLSITLVQCSPPSPTATPISRPSDTATARPTATQEPSPTTTVSPCITHVTQPGDTLWGLANRYGTTVEAIKNANGLTDSLIHSGTTLCIPTSDEPLSGTPVTVGSPASSTPEAPPPTPTDTPVTPKNTATLAPPADVVVNPVCSRFDAPGYDHDNTVQEFVCFINNGGRAANMEAWKLRDVYGVIYTFPAFSLNPGASVRVRTGCGQDTATDLYWCMDRAVWNNPEYGGDTVFLYDAGGSLVTQYRYQ